MSLPSSVRRSSGRARPARRSARLRCAPRDDTYARLTLALHTLFALGLITPIAALALLAVMLMAVATVHWTKGLWVTNGGYEYNLVLSAVAAALALAGPEIYALDYVFRIAWPEPATFLIRLGVGIPRVSVALPGI